MSSNTKWSLGDTPPDPTYLEVPTPEEAAAIRDEVDKNRDAERKKLEAAIARGKAKAKANVAAPEASAP